MHEIHERPICIEIGEKNGYMDNFSIAKFKVFGFSACGQYLALTHELYPTTLWIWDICTDYLDYMLLENPISGINGVKLINSFLKQLGLSFLHH